MDRHKKALIVGASAVGIVGLYVVYKRSKSATTAATTNPNAVVMVSSANTNMVNGVQHGTGFMSALSEEAAISKQLSQLETQPGTVGTPTPAPVVNPGGTIKYINPGQPVTTVKVPLF